MAAVKSQAIGNEGADQGLPSVNVPCTDIFWELPARCSTCVAISSTVQV